MSSKRLRAMHANDLIKAIASHGRRFFYNAASDRVARLDLDQHGQVLYYDEYTGRRIYTMHEGAWRGFSHGGTMRGLVVDMRDYIRWGTGIVGIRDHRIPLSRIAAPDFYKHGGNLWGYSQEAADALREQVRSMPIIKPQADA